MRRAASGLGREAARQQLASTNPKFHAGKNPIEQEDALKIIEPTTAQQQKEVLRIIERMYGQANSNQKQALDFYKAQLSTEGATNEVKMQFLRRFYFWLLGRGEDRDHVKTMWGRGNVAVYNKEVAAYIEQFAEKRLEYALQLALLAQRVPTTLNGFYLYFKYVVNGELERKSRDGVEFWDLSKDNFLQDFELFAMEFDGGKYADAIRPAASRPADKKPFGGPPDNKTVGSTEPYPAGEDDAFRKANKTDLGDDSGDGADQFVMRAASGISKRFGFVPDDEDNSAAAVKATKPLPVDFTETDDEGDSHGYQQKLQIDQVTKAVVEAMKKTTTRDTEAQRALFAEVLEKQAKDLGNGKTKENQAALAELAEQVKTYTAEVKQKGDENHAKALAKISELEKGIQSGAKLDDLAVTLGAVTTDIAKLREAVTGIQKGGGTAPADVQTKLDELVAQRDEQAKKLTESEKTSAALHGELKRIAADKAAEVLQKEGFIKDIEDLRQQLEHKSGSESELKSKLTEAEERVKAVVKNYTQASLRTEQLTKERDRLAAELNRQQELEPQEQNARDAKIAELERTIEQGKKILQSEYGRAENYQKQIEESQEDVARAFEELSTKKEEIAKAAVEEFMKKEKDRLDKEFDKIELEKVELEKQRKDLRSEAEKAFNKWRQGEAEKIAEEGKMRFNAEVAAEARKQTMHLEAQILALQELLKGGAARIATEAIQEGLKESLATARANATEASRSAEASAEQSLADARKQAEFHAEGKAVKDALDKEYSEMANFLQGQLRTFDQQIGALRALSMDSISGQELSRVTNEFVAANPAFRSKSIGEQTSAAFKAYKAVNEMRVVQKIGDFNTQLQKLQADYQRVMQQFSDFMSDTKNVTRLSTKAKEAIDAAKKLKESVMG